MKLVDGQTVGIDLGTTYSAIARLNENGEPASIPGTHGELTTPSVVILGNDGHISVGPSTEELVHQDPACVVEAIKREMGRKDWYKVYQNRRLTPEFISALILKKLKQEAETRIGPIGNAVITVRATDTNGSYAETSFAVTVAPGPVFSTQPESRTVAPGESVTLTATALGATSFQWQRNGVDLSGANSAVLTLNSVQPADAGVYVARASDGAVTRRSEPAVVALLSTSKVIGAGSEVGTDIVHPVTGFAYDQILLQGAAATITADPGQIVRMSYIDTNDDIVQVQFSGAGALTVTLDNPSGPATPVKYNQSVTYMKGQAAIVVGGVDATTNLSIFSVGRANAVNQALFRSEVAYDGMADISLVAIAPASGAIGGVRTANARYTGSSGLVGVYAPRVAISGPLFIGNVAASGAGVPVIVTGSAGDVRITGGSLQEPNGAAVQVDGMTRIQMAAGTDSHGNLQPAQALSVRLERSGVDVTSVMVPAGG